MTNTSTQFSINIFDGRKTNNFQNHFTVQNKFLLGNNLFKNWKHFLSWFNYFERKLHSFEIFPSTRSDYGGWKDSLVVRSTGCSPRGSQLNSQHPKSSSQNLWFQSRGICHPLLVSTGTRYRHKSWQKSMHIIKK